MKKYIVFGDYRDELKDNSFRCDLKVLGYFEAENMEDAKRKIKKECFLENIYDYEEELRLVEIGKLERLDIYSYE